MIKTNGANVSPQEVEDALERHPEITEAVVFGVSDSARGEAIVAVIVPRNGASVDRDGLLVHLRDQVSSFKVPHFVFAMCHEDIPRTDSTKVKKHLLKELVLTHWDQFLATTSQSRITTREPS